MPIGPYIVVLYPLLFSLFLIPLRRRSLAIWWLAAAAFACCTLCIQLLVQHEHNDAESWFLMLLFAVVPTLIVFLGLRVEVFTRHLFLMPPAAVVLFVIGVTIAINVYLMAGYSM
jgi:hypothetical protein